jgi:hypothetical protein
MPVRANNPQRMVSRTSVLDRSGHAELSSSLSPTDLIATAIIPSRPGTMTAGEYYTTDCRCLALAPGGPPSASYRSWISSLPCSNPMLITDLANFAIRLGSELGRAVEGRHTEPYTMISRRARGLLRAPDGDAPATNLGWARHLSTRGFARRRIQSTAGDPSL